MTEDELEELEKEEEKSSLKTMKDLQELERLEKEITEAETKLRSASLDEDKYLEQANLDDLEKKASLKAKAFDSMDQIEEDIGKVYMDDKLKAKENKYGLSEYDIEEVDNLMNEEIGEGEQTNLKRSGSLKFNVDYFDLKGTIMAKRRGVVILKGLVHRIERNHRSLRERPPYGDNRPCAWCFYEQWLCHWNLRQFTRSHFIGG